MVSPKDTCTNTDLKRISFNAVFIYTTSVIIAQKLTIPFDIDIAPLKFSANFQSWTTLFDDDKAYNESHQYFLMTHVTVMLFFPAKARETTVD